MLKSVFRPPQIVQFNPSTDYNVPILGARMLPVPCTTDFCCILFTVLYFSNLSDFLFFVLVDMLLFATSFFNFFPVLPFHLSRSSNWLFCG